jgi:hypothetical protein
MMSIKRSVVSLLVGAGLAVGAVAVSAPVSADTSSLGASLNRFAADEEEPAPADTSSLGASLNRFGADEEPATDEGEDEGLARRGASLN